MGPKAKGQRRVRGNIMTKKRPKMSREEEEGQAMALFDTSIPTAKRTSKVQRVYEEEEDDHQSSSSESESSEEEIDAARQLMSELGAADSLIEESSDATSSDAEEEGEDIDSAEEYGESEGSDVSESDDEASNPDKKRAAESDSEGESGEESGKNSGSDDELSLADSSASEKDETERETQTVRAGSDKKRQRKALDCAVDPDDLPEANHLTRKVKSLVKETIKPSDTFCEHFERDIEDDVVSLASDRKQWLTEKLKIEELGQSTYSHIPSTGSLSLPAGTATLPSLGLRSRLFNLIGKTLRLHCGVSQTTDQEPTLSAEQKQMFCILNQYKDLYNPRLTFTNLEQYRLVYCLHSLNHILKTRLQVTLNSEEKWSAENRKKDFDKEYRDQGLTRPKVLILAPFKESARRIISMFESLLMTKKKSFVTNKKRFTEEFSPPEDASINPKKPDDYIQMFQGNSDDCFRLGVQLSKSGMKLYADFYKADILICSPLGLRMILGADGDERRDYDFISSIEVLIMDQADVFLMQNWDHVLHLLEQLHVQPKESHDTDFSRVRMWTLNGHSKHYRQTIVQSSVHDPLLAAIFAKHCSNYSGEVRLQPLPSTGSICHITSAMPLIFQRFSCTSYASLPNDRFDYFISQVLPQYTSKQHTGTLIFVPSYYDYVRIRNHLAKQQHETSLVCEYASDKAIRRAKKKFFTKETHFMLYTERVHFFRRMQLRKIRHLIFYSLPTYPQFFSDVCNMYKTGGQADASCLVLFSNYEAHKLSMCVGTERTKHIVNAKKNLFMFVTGDEQQ